MILSSAYFFMSRRNYNIKMYHNKLDFDGLDCIQLPWVEDRWWAFGNTIMNFYVL